MEITSKPKRFSILGVAHPFLDIIANVNEDFLKKYDLQANGAIIAEPEKHGQLCEELMRDFSARILPGGSIQNAIRTAQLFFPKHPQVCMVMGCVGQDDYGHRMKNSLEYEDQVKTLFMDDVHGRPTGRCACLITGPNRSLISFLGACNGFQIDHLERNHQYLDSAKIIYTGGFFLKSNPKSTFRLADVVQNSQDTKKFVFNLAAPYVMKNQTDQFLKLLPYIDLLFGNIAEVQALAQALQWDEKDPETMVLRLARFGTNRKRRTMIITQDSRDILVAFNGEHKVIRYPVPMIAEEQIVDTNGCGDAFAGAFLAYDLMNRSLDECIKAGIYAAQHVIKQHGCTLKALMDNDPNDKQHKNKFGF